MIYDEPQGQRIRINLTEKKIDAGAQAINVTGKVLGDGSIQPTEIVVFPSELNNLHQVRQMIKMQQE